MENILFDAYKSKNLELKNRIVMAPMTRSRSDNPENKATELTAQYYRQRATAGLMITEGTFISPEAVGVINVPAIYSSAQIEGWKITTEAIHREGSKIFAQLWHTGAYSHPDLHNGKKPLAPSDINPQVQVLQQQVFRIVKNLNRWLKKILNRL